jgi:hypothetical protein
VVKGLSLNGSEKGIEFYIGNFDANKLLIPELWMDAVIIFNYMYSK